MSAFTKEQNALLIEYGNDMKSAFDAHAKKLGDAFVEINEKNMARFDDEIKRVTVHGDNLNKTYELYASRVIAEVRAGEAAAKARHDAHMKELRIASIATIYASGRGLDTSNSIIRQIEELVNNPESHI